MPFAKRGDVVHSEATSGFNNQKKSLLINGLAALGDSHRPLQSPAQLPSPRQSGITMFSGTRCQSGEMLSSSRTNCSNSAALSMSWPGATWSSASASAKRACGPRWLRTAMSRMVGMARFLEAGRDGRVSGARQPVRRAHSVTQRATSIPSRTVPRLRDFQAKSAPSACQPSANSYLYDSESSADHARPHGESCAALMPFRGPNVGFRRMTP